MKFIKTPLLLMAILFITIFACKKDEDDPTPTPTNPANTTDSVAPVITVNGNNPDTIFLGAGAYTDPGATALDAHDGAVTVSSNASSTNPNITVVGNYTITYTATDSAGNSTNSIRTVRVENHAYMYAGTYAVTDDVAGSIFNYGQVITVDATVDNRLHFSRFADYLNNNNIYANLSAGVLIVPLQTAVNIGTGPGTCDVATHMFRSTSFSLILNGFNLGYVDSLTAPSICSGNVVAGTMQFVK